MPAAGVLAVDSNERKEPLELPGLIVTPRPGPARTKYPDCGSPGVNEDDARQALDTARGRIRRLRPSRSCELPRPWR